MWCTVCLSDVATEVAPDHRRVICSSCGTVLGEAPASAAGPQTPPASTRASEARDLLNRWASNHLLDPYGPPAKGASAAKPESAREDSGRAGGDSAASRGPSFRIDSHPTDSQRERGESPSSRQDNPRPADRPSGTPRGEQSAAQRSNPVAANEGDAQDQFHTGGGSGREGRQSSAERPRYGAPAPHALTSFGMHDMDSSDRTPQDQRPHDESSDWDSPRASQSSGSSSSRSPRHRYHDAHDDWSDQPASDNDSRRSTSGRDLQTSADELDRLTNEILARVSQISDERRRQLDEVAQPQASSEPRKSSSRPSIHPLARSAATTSTRDEQPAAASSGSGRGNGNSNRDGHRTGGSEERGLPDDGERPLPANASFRADSGHAGVPAAHATPRPQSSASGMRRVSAVSRQAETPEPAPVKSGGTWASSIGQGLAYLGILGLTAGTSLVIVSYFGGDASPRLGWLISTIGQMLLFLGIVTLVSGGMEQTTDEVKKAIEEVSRRLDKIGDRLIRIEAGHESGPPRPHLLDHARDRSTAEVREESQID